MRAPSALPASRSARKMRFFMRCSWSQRCNMLSVPHSVQHQRGLYRGMSAIHQPRRIAGKNNFPQSIRGSEASCGARLGSGHSPASHYRHWCRNDLSRLQASPSYCAIQGRWNRRCYCCHRGAAKLLRDITPHPNLRRRRNSEFFR